MFQRTSRPRRKSGYDFLALIVAARRRVYGQRALKYNVRYVNLYVKRGDSSGTGSPLLNHFPTFVACNLCVFHPREVTELTR